MGKNGGEGVLADLPAPVRRVLEELDGAGHPSFLVGGCVRDLLRGEAPVDFDVATPASPQAVLELFPSAVAIGVRHGTVMVPTRSGPVDVSSFRGGPALEDDLAHRDFTVNAIAHDPRHGRLVDPFEGRADLAKGRLRAVGSAQERFEEDPLRALRAARIAAALELEVEPEVERAMAGFAHALRGVARERVRQELVSLLLARGVTRGLELLRRSGIEAELAPGAAADAAQVVAVLPVDLELRLAGWLRGTRVLRVLRQLRFSRGSAERVERLLRWHPIEIGVAPSRDASVRRHLKRIGEGNAAALLALRRAELAAGRDSRRPQVDELRRRVDAVEEAFERVRAQGRLALHRHALAIDGVEVMRVLGLPPGPAVGRALAHLTDLVVEEPARNEPETLRALLREWAGR
jgi:tRNA nucleotidyltransferase (CCA-adding enzyme)